MAEEMSITITREDLRVMIRDAVRDAFSDVGIHHEDAETLEYARADFRFVRNLRKGIEGAQSKIGAAVITAVVAGLVFMLGLGAKSWIGK